MRFRIRLLCGFLWAACVLGWHGMVFAGALESVNAVRQAAGLTALEPSVELQQSAQAHADYLSQYLLQGGISTVSAHEQSRSLPGFSGELAPDRAAYFNYPHSLVTENISIGNKTVDESISALMSAIYHRFAFLDPQIDQLGYAESQRRYVFNMGQSKLAQACREQSPEARATPSHDCLGNRMKATAFEQLCQQLPTQAVYAPPYASRCPNGALLQDSFMQQVCQSPPSGAVLRGSGRYYNACGNGLKLSASWFERICQSDDPNIVYPHTGGYYEICNPAQRVHAQWYENLCENLPAEMADTDSGRYYKVCNEDFQLKSEYYEELQSDALEKAPIAIVWPADGTVDIQPVFYNEDPHPTPDLPQTGYPLSIQFNPQKVDQVSIMGFMLEEAVPGSPLSWRSVDSVRQIDHLTDINNKLSRYEFAWFPLQRLNWGTRYRYRVDALVDGVFQQFSAGFATTALQVPVYAVDSETKRLSVNEKHFILYRPPDSYDEFPFQQVGLSYRSRPYVDVSVIDTNTVELKVGGFGCAPVTLRTRLEAQLQIDFCGRRRFGGLF